MIEIKPMQPEDLQAVLNNPIEGDIRFFTVLPDQPAVSAWYKGKVIGVGGINLFWEGVGEAWVLLSKDIESCRFGTYRMIRRMFKSLTKEYGLQRLQATVRSGWWDAIKMVEKLGFQREGLMKHYCPNGDDVIMYSITKD